MEDRFISKTERVYLFILGCTISAVNAVNLLIVWLDKVYNPPTLQIYDIARTSLFPMGRLMSIFIVIVLLFARRYFVSLGWTFLCLMPSLYEFISAYRIIHSDADILYKTPAFALIALIANPLDYLSFFLTIVLLIWLLSAVVRSFTVSDIAGLR